jgi:shikimate kinase
MRIPTKDRKSRIYLTGFMGSGKSTIGPILANTLGYDFLDLDHWIEQREGGTVSEIFRERGEAYFRECERLGIVEASTRPQTVVALGGGGLADPRNIDRVLATGILIFLNVALEGILRRVYRKTSRPLLTDAEGQRLSLEAARGRVTTLLDQRRPLYEMADLTICADDMRVGVTVDHIVKKLLPLFR